MKKLLTITIAIMLMMPGEASALRPMATRKAGRRIFKRRQLLSISAAGAGVAALLHLLRQSTKSSVLTDKKPMHSHADSPFPALSGLWDREWVDFLDDLKKRDIGYIKSVIDHPSWNDNERLELIKELSWIPLNERPDVAEEYISFLKIVAEDTSRSNNERSQAIYSIHHLCLGKEHKEALQILLNLQKRRSVEEVLPSQRIRRKAILAIGDKHFKEQSHGYRVETAMRNALGGNAGSVRIGHVEPIFDEGNDLYEWQYTTPLLDFQRENNNSAIIICWPHSNDFKPFKVNGVLDLESTKSLGRSEVVFVVAATTKAHPISTCITPLLDNVIVVSAAKRNGLKLVREDLAKPGIDIDFYISGNLDDEYEGTSIAAGHMAALLYLYIEHHPDASIKEAIQFFRDIAEPMPPDEFFDKGRRSPGYIDIETARDKITNSSTEKTKITVPADRQGSIAPPSLLLPFAFAASA